MSDTLGGESLALDSDENFIPMLCNQLDAVYTRYRVSESVELDDGTRTALQRAMELLTAARADTKDRKAGRTMDRVMRQTEEILARYNAAPSAGDAPAAEGTTADVPTVAAEAGNGPVATEAESDAPAEAQAAPKRAPRTRKKAAPKEAEAVAVETGAEAAAEEAPTEPTAAETPAEPVAPEAAATTEPAEKKPRSRRRTPASFPEYGAVAATEVATSPETETIPEKATTTDEVAVSEEPGRRRGGAVLILAAALVAALAAVGIFAAEWNSKSDSLNSARDQLATTQKQLTTAQANLTSAQSKATGDSQSLAQDAQKVRQLQAQLAAAKRHPSVASGRAAQTTTTPTVASLQQQLSAAQAQVRVRNNQLLALQACAQDESAVITYQGSGQTANAAQAEQVAQAQCQRANNLGA